MAGDQPSPRGVAGADGGSLDFFIAHASLDAASAELLYALLAEHATVFLDTRSLRPGDDWDRELRAAQRRAHVTVVLVSRHTEDAFYQRAEIAHAVDMARSGSHRVVPVWLTPLSALDDVPDGLRITHGIEINDAVTLEDAAATLLTLRREERAAPRSVEMSVRRHLSAHGSSVVERLDFAQLSRGRFVTSTQSRAAGRHVILTDPVGAMWRACCDVDPSVKRRKLYLIAGLKATFGGLAQLFSSGDLLVCRLGFEGSGFVVEVEQRLSAGDQYSARNYRTVFDVRSSSEAIADAIVRRYEHHARAGALFER
jgi:hypothetical protein